VLAVATCFGLGGFIEPVAPALGASSSCGTPGKDGAVTYTSGVPNTYYAGSGTLAAGSTTVTLGAINSAASSTAFTAGDMALIIQMQGATIDSSNSAAYGSGGTTGSGWTGTPTAGTYEYVSVRAVSGSTLTIASANGGGLLNSYTEAAASSSHGAQTFQIIRVPQYKSFTFGSGDNLYTAPWNGSSGGVIALDVVGTLTLAATINADGYGFRGGGQNTWGKSYPGTSATSTTQATPDGASDNDWTYSVGSGDTNITTALAYSTYNGGPDGFKGEGIAGTPIWTYTSGASAPAFSPSTATYSSDGVSAGYPGGSKAKGAPGNAGGGAMDGNANGYGPVGHNPAASTSFNQYNAGGGGGGNGGAGGLGGENWSGSTANGTADGSTATQGIGGAAFTNSATRLIMGGGGGAGSNNDGSAGTRSIAVGGGQTVTPTAATASSGGEGGGIVMLRVGSITSGTVSAKGIAAPDPDQDGGGGGGAGGTIVITATGTISGVTAIASGGSGASSTGGNGGPTDYANGYYHGPGGGGGGGAVLASGSGVTATVTGGPSGTTTSANSPYFATAGSAGTSSTSVTPASIPGARSGAECEELLIAKRVTSINGTAQAGYTADGATDPSTGTVIDASPYWPMSGGSPAIIGLTTIAAGSKPGDKIEYTIYYLSAGGSAVSAAAICDYVPPDTTLINAYNTTATPTAYAEVITGFASPSAPTYYTGTVTTGSGVYAVNTTTGAGAPAVCGVAPKSTVTGKYSSDAIYDNPGTIAPFSSTDSGYGKIAFTVQVN
jgi:hypothetical protein